MFNGIILNTGKINNIIKKGNNCTLEIKSNMKFYKKEIGSSICCSGTCLTLESYRKNLIKFYLSKETLNKTSFKYLKKGSIVNIEKSLKFGQRISGHFIQGHVDTTAKVKKIYLVGKSWLINFVIKKNYLKNLVQKGSITINGISLTVATILKDGFQIAVIPKTLKMTNLFFLKKNDFVNVELDIMGKYVKKFIDEKK